MPDSSDSSGLSGSVGRARDWFYYLLGSPLLDISQSDPSEPDHPCLHLLFENGFDLQISFDPSTGSMNVTGVAPDNADADALSQGILDRIVQSTEGDPE